MGRVKRHHFLRIGLVAVFFIILGSMIIHLADQPRVGRPIGYAPTSFNYFFPLTEGTGLTITDTTTSLTGYLETSIERDRTPDWTKINPTEYALNFSYDSSGLGSVSRWVRIPYQSNLEPQTFTIEAWVRPEVNNGQAQYIIVKDGTSATDQNTGYRLWYQHPNYCFQVKKSSAWSAVQCNSGSGLNNWDHVAASYQQSSGTLAVYVNGNSLSSVTGAGAIQYSQGDLFIGSPGRETNPQYNFQGLIADVVITNSVSTSSNPFNLKPNIVTTGNSPSGLTPDAIFTCAFDSNIPGSIELHTDRTGSMQKEKSFDYTQVDYASLPNNGQVSFTLTNLNQGTYQWNCIAYDLNGNSYQGTQKSVSMQLARDLITTPKNPDDKEIFETTLSSLPTAFQCEVTSTQIKQVELWHSNGGWSRKGLNTTFPPGVMYNIVPTISQSTYANYLLSGFEANKAADGNDATLWDSGTRTISNNGMIWEINLTQPYTINRSVIKWSGHSSFSAGSCGSNTAQFMFLNGVNTRSQFDVNYAVGDIITDVAVNKQGINHIVIFQGTGTSCQFRGTIKEVELYSQDFTTGGEVNNWLINFSYSQPEGTHTWTCNGLTISDARPVITENRTVIVSRIPSVTLGNVYAGATLISGPSYQTYQRNLRFECSATGSNFLRNMTLYTDTGGTFTAREKKTYSGGTASFTLSDLNPGSYQWNCLAENAFGTTAFSSADKTITILQPTIVARFDNPVDGFTTTDNNVTLQCNGTGHAQSPLVNMTFYVKNTTGNWTANKFPYTSGRFLYNLTGLQTGSYEWYCEVQNSFGDSNRTATNRTFNIQTQPQYTICQNNACVTVNGIGTNQCSADANCQSLFGVNLISPTDGYTSYLANANFQMNCSATGNTNDSLSLYTNLTGTWQETQTKQYTSGIATFNLTSVPVGVYVWNCRVNDTNGNYKFNETNKTFAVQTPMHLECRNNACVSVNGEGTNQCNTDANCQNIMGINLIEPANGITTTNQNVQLNCSATGNNLQSITLYTNASGWTAKATNAYTVPGTKTTFAQTLTPGTYAWNCQVNDSFNNSKFNETNKTVTIQTATHLECRNNACVSVAGIGTNQCSIDANCQSLFGVNLISPATGYTTTNSSVEITCSATGNDTLSLYTNRTGTWQETSIIKPYTGIPYIFILSSLTVGNYAWNCRVNDTSGNFNFNQTNRTFTIQQAAQTHLICQNNACVSINGAGTNECTVNANCTNLFTVNLLEPASATTIAQQNTTLNCSATGNNLQTMTLYTSAGGYGPKATVPYITSGSKASFPQTFTSGSYQWNCRVQDLNNNTQFASANRTIIINLTQPQYGVCQNNACVTMNGSGTDQCLSNPSVCASFVPVQLISPANNTQTVNTTVILQCNTTSANRQNITLYTNRTGTWQRELTYVFTGTETPSFTINAAIGRYAWNCLAYDTNRNYGWSVNRTFEVINNPVQLFIKDTSENETIYTNTNITFYANYTNGTTPITGAACNVNVLSTNYAMVYSATLRQYAYSRIINQPGDHDYNITCSLSGYPTRSVVKTATIMTICGDSSCSQGETCSSCSADCGQCNDDNDAGGGGGGGGGGAGAPKIRTLELNITNADIEKIVIVYNASTLLKVNVTERNTNPYSSFEGIVYKYFNITPSFTNGIINTSIFFRVRNSWITQNNINDATVKMKKYNASWITLTTQKLSSDNSYTHYKAVTNKFSIFAMYGFANQNDTVAPPQTHLACVGNACISVSGSGQNQCATNADCVPLPPPQNETPGQNFTEPPGESWFIDNILWIVIGFIVLAGIGIAGFFFMKPHEEVDPGKIESLRSYVYSCRAQGYSNEEIEKRLVNSGWDKKTVKQIIPKTSVSEKSIPAEKLEEIREFINTSKKQGYNKKQIKEMLSSQGWAKKDIDDIVK
ncbi:PGF-pre-PGF domain-containing protein [Candidatus Woesearchaeota archaeon]|nr:MAG: PGF-pre-PGF domain-containing protein [Candidatus Woesearchaeota archaeon]